MAGSIATLYGVRQRVFPLRADKGEIRWIATIAEDVTDLQEAQQALHESEERPRQFGDASQDVLWMRDASTLQWIYLTKAFEEIYGFPREQALKGDNLDRWLEFIVPEDRDHAFDNIERVRLGENVSFEFRIRLRSDDQIRWMRNTDFPIRDASGKIVRIGGIGRDITGEKKATERAALLLAELQHRVRNTLAVIRSIVKRTADSSASVEDFEMHLSGRIGAFARVQALVTRNPEAGIDPHQLIAEELLAYNAKEDRAISIVGPDVRLQPKAAETMDSRSTNLQQTPSSMAR